MPGKKLSDKDLEQFREHLLLVRGVLTGDVAYLELEALDGAGRTSESREDAGAEGYFQELNLELLERDGETLRQVDEALVRIQQKSFGVCEECEQWIRRERLRAVPHARFCIDCQRRAEAEGS